ncbi:MAG: hypothetical protein JAY90_19995 [Candidatus Thiodiazotropha lotti]|nr:hypothetical protein [Candidatus Thiodiazotropha lotti]
MDQEQSTIITMFIHHLQTKGLWPCFMQVGEEPQPIDHNELFKLRDEFVGRKITGLEDNEVMR